MAVWSETTTTEILATRRIDAEFSQPKYLEAERKIRSCKVENLGNLGVFVPGPFGSAFRVSNYDFQSPYRYIRGQDVKPFFILEDDSRFIPHADFIRLQRYTVKKDDLMISVVGTLGNVAVCTERVTPAMFSCKSTIFRTEKIDPYYLLAYLNSHYGQLCLLRRQRGAIQMGLNIEDLRSIPIPRLGELEEGRIAKKVRKSHDELISSRESYQSAQQLLESELGLDKLRFHKPVGYTVQLSDLELSRRTDADFFNPELRYYQLELEKRHLLKQLSNYARVLKFSNPPYANNGIPIITQKHLGKIAPDNYGDDLVALDSWVKINPQAVIRQYDLLYYSVGAYLGKTNQWLSKNQAVHASFITMLRCNNEADAGFLQVLLNSSYGILQSKCFQSGTSQPYIYPKDIRRFLIPDVSTALKQEINKLVIESYQKSEDSKLLLEQAKTRVEQLIEETVKS